MKKILITVASFLMLLACQPKPSQGEQLLSTLNEQNLSLVVLNNDSISNHNAPRVDDLFYLSQNEPERLKGAVVADKMVGNAAATLLAACGVSEVHTNVITTHAKQILKAAGVKVVAAREVDMIYNRDHSDQCPMDKALNDANTVEEGMAILKEKFYNE